MAQKHNPQALKIKPQYEAYLPLYDKVEIVDRVNALVLVEGAEDYETFIRKLNPIISKYVTALTIRAKRTYKKKGKGKNSATE